MTDRDAAAKRFPAAGIVRRARRIADMSQREMATACKLARTTIGRIEAGTLTPSLGVLLTIIKTAGLHLVVVDDAGTVIVPMEIWDDRRDGAGRVYPAHFDVVLDPQWGHWWADRYGLTSPPETYSRSRAYRDAKRRLSQWEVRVAKYRHDPRPIDPDGRIWQQYYERREN